ncbi:MAG: adenylate kinase [Candidatus Aenigmarchaeota archaeon]|nr:adenylate kinase [Candidatus Aenigmarchaeota archaeon]
MNIVLLGHPGSGKGTQAKLLQKKYGIAHISTGEMFRSIAKEHTELGRKVKSLIESGAFVPDDVTVRVVRERLAKPDCTKGFILDGFPRTEQQADELQNIAPIDHVIHIHVEDETVLKRLSARRNCARCGTVYGLDRVPKQSGTCDTCREPLAMRADDDPKKIKRRIEIYHAETKPLIDYYKRKRLYATVNGDQDIGKVFRDICGVLEGKKVTK